jgi:hypothetical protein
MRSDHRLREPWHAFLSDLDSQLTQSTEIHCLGGFVVSELYGLHRPTADVDTFWKRPRELMLPRWCKLLAGEANYTSGTASTWTS